MKPYTPDIVESQTSALIWGVYTPSAVCRLSIRWFLSTNEGKEKGEKLCLR